jgi:hypothetical protein
MKRTLAAVPVIAVFAAITFLALCRSATAAPVQGDPIAQAKAFFQRYVELEHAFDPAQADLYSDKAVIKNKRFTADGKVVPVTLPAMQYKNAVRAGMAKARSRGDVATYTNDTYTLEGDKVRIHVTRYLALKKYSSPMSMLVGPDPSGQWMIFEEDSESHM